MTNLPLARLAVSPAAGRALGLTLGVLADAVLADPRRGHPVAGFGRLATALERRLHADDALRGALFTGVCVGGPVLLGALTERLTGAHPWGRVLVTGTACWAVLGGTSLAREGVAMARLIEADDLPAARSRLSHLCARDATGMDAGALSRATVESLAENASDAVVAPLLWGAVAGVPGLLGYRAINTLDAMVGYRSERYARFGRASARLDDAVNLVPARVTGLLVAVCAPVVSGSPGGALRVLARDGARHPSPNAGRPEAAAAGALGVELGGRNVYAGHGERRPVLGAGGRPPRVADVRRAVRLGRAGAAAGAALAVGLAALLGRAESSRRAASVRQAESSRRTAAVRR